ncbi:exonuclease 3'-5' domain-containing protein 2 isoform X2 [Calliphora vicina]|uniref:exonuclease 3'-5' domain-containing protein 2 isoform X2 n=1 Tax=Calliphora vicina TaxID=7373 RepID=UPI00325B0FAB
MDNARNKFSKTALIAAAGLGLVIVVATKRKRIFRYLKKINDPMKHRRIEVIQTVDDCHRVVSELKKDCKTLNVLGFDCEWVTVGGTRRPTALLQLSSGEGLCALFRLCCMKQIPKSLRDLLEDDNVLKVGVAPQGDAQKLAHDYSVGVASTFDLRFLAALTGRKPEGLAKMSKSVLNVELDKHWRIVCSNWEAKDLSEKQLDYAANDALVAVEIFKKLSNDLIPKSFWQSKSDFQCIRVKLEPFYDVHFKEGFIADLNKERTNKNVANSKGKIDRSCQGKSQVRGISTRSKALYDNCLLEAPDGELLCTIDRRKAKWYLDQCLGSQVKSEPFTVRLNFEPAGRAVGEVGKYYQTPKENQCVVCGRKESFIRKNVVPREYRKHFPEVMKSHTSHDVLLLCPTCHQLSNISDMKVRHKLSHMCDAPFIYKEGAYKLKEIPELRQIKSAARALLKCGNKIPENRRKSLESTVLNHYKEETEIHLNLLQKASEIDTKITNENYSQHGEKVVQKFQTDHGGLLELEKIWREHFIHTMQPKYLPSLWNINHNANRNQS